MQDTKICFVENKTYKINIPLFILKIIYVAIKCDKSTI